MLLNIYVLLIIKSFSYSYHDSKALNLLKAKNLKELKYSINHFELIETLKSKCEFEVDAKAVPESCYKYIMLNKKTIGASAYNKQLLKLDELCEESRLSKKTDKTPIHLSERCKKIVERRNQELDYIEKEQNPYGYVIGP